MKIERELGMCLTAGSNRVQICTHLSSIMITVYLIRHLMALRLVLLIKSLNNAKRTSRLAFCHCGENTWQSVSEARFTSAHGSGGSSSHCGLCL